MKLTQTVKKGGCAAKVPAMVLREILAGVNFPPNIDGVMVDGSKFDDAAIFKISDSHSLVQTLDFFTPIVDDPKDFGAVAAANALSDVYAMGGRPKTCMAILAAPLAEMENSVIQEVLNGACEKMTEAKASLVGGHSIDDDTLKFGLSVTGLVGNDAIWTNEKAKVGDVLILTKAIGTGTICAGVKRGELTSDRAQEAIKSMKTLNNIIDFLDENDIKAIHASTDITGFGIAGHGYQMAKASQVSLIIDHKKIPLFIDTLHALNNEWLTKAHKSNEQYTKDFMQFDDNISLQHKLTFFDPQTSGGLLISVESSQAQSIVEKLKPHFPKISIVGQVEELKDRYVVVG